MTPERPSSASTHWPEEYRVFRYLSYRFDQYQAVFEYELAGKNDSLRFVETVEFPPPSSRPSSQALEAFRRVVELLYLIAGISYYKVAAPQRIEILSVPFPAGIEGYLRNLYAHGLGEFAFTNNLPRALRPELVSLGPADQPPLELPSALDTPLVAVGGGKDSIVSLELLRQVNVSPTLFSVNPNRVMREVIDVSGTPALSAKRTIDKQLFELNRRGAYNGHIPVTAINSLIAVGTSVLHGLGPVVMSNERSASSANLTWRGQEINHQWSKSLTAERELADVLATQLGTGARYFSLLRPLSELHIAKIFAKTTGYDAAFTSCNAVFKLENPATAWCGDCPKCRFVFLALAPFMTKDRLTAIFGKNLLDDVLQLPGYRELTGLVGQKPFDCVGEISESLVALQLAANSTAWGEEPVVKQLISEIPPQKLPTPELSTEIFTPSGAHFIPGEYAKILECV